jgi:hypothetical protein
MMTKQGEEAYDDEYDDDFSVSYGGSDDTDAIPCNAIYERYNPSTNITDLIEFSHQACERFCYSRPTFACHGLAYQQIGEGSLCVDHLECILDNDCALLHECVSRNEQCLGKCTLSTTGILVVVFSCLLFVTCFVMGVRKNHCRNVAKVPAVEMARIPAAEAD